MKAKPASVLDGVKADTRYGFRFSDGELSFLRSYRHDAYITKFVVLAESDYRRLVRDYKRLLNKESKP